MTYIAYIVGGLSFLFGGLIFFILAGVVAYFAEWSFAELFIGGGIGYVLKLILFILFKEFRASYTPTNTGYTPTNTDSIYSRSSSSSSSYSDSFMSSRDRDRVTSASSPITDRR